MGPTGLTTHSVLRHLDVGTVGRASQQESRARQRHLPPISVYRWWARRTESVTGALIDAVSADTPGKLLIADPFSGGGVIALAALLRGHRVYAQDVNPWAARSLATMLRLPAPQALDEAAEKLHERNAALLADAYSTVMSDGTPGTVSHTIRVATASCPGCDRPLYLFPGGLVSLITRVDCGGNTGWLACSAGHLSFGPANRGISCPTCGRCIKPEARYTTRRTARCAECNWSGKLGTLATRGLAWVPVLVERVGSSGREITEPSPAEFAAAAPDRWMPVRQLAQITSGAETSVLLRHGMRYWHDLYPQRQRVVLETLFHTSRDSADGDRIVSDALVTALVGCAEMAGHTSRWDPRYLKAYEAMANHRFSFTTLAAEPNVWGVPGAGRGTFDKRLRHLTKAEHWLKERIGRPLMVDGPCAVTSPRTAIPPEVDVRVVSGGSQQLCIPTGSLDAVITDPPYHDDVQYAELSDLFRAWAGDDTGPLAGDAIVRPHTNKKETDTYLRILEGVFLEVKRGLRAGGHLVLSYANRNPAAWVALFTALQDAEFQTVGYTVVHSENETDHAKAGRRACNLDLILDLVPGLETMTQQHQPEGEAKTTEEAFCRLVGEYALRIGYLKRGWERELTDAVLSDPFIAG